jgi:hypothetical protein
MVGKTPQVREIVFNILDDNGERTVVAKGATSVDVGDTNQLFTRTSNLEVLSSNNFSNISNVQSNIVSIEGFMSQFSGSVYSPLLLQLQSHHTDNVTRIDTLFTDLAANAVNVDGTFSNVIVLQDDLSANVTRINTLFTDLQANAVNVDGTFSNVLILQSKQTTDYANISTLQGQIASVTNFGSIVTLGSDIVALKNRVASSTVRVGEDAGGGTSDTSSLAIGAQAGNFMGTQSIAIGALANYNANPSEATATARSIVINATGAPLTAPRSDTLVIGSIEEDNSNIICMMGANVLSSTTGACEITRTSLLKLMDSNVHISTNVSIANDTILFRPNGNGSFGGDIDINATLEVGGTSSFGGAMTLNDNLETTGTSSFGGKMEVNNDIDCNGESFIMKNGSAQKIILRDDGTADFVSDVDVGGKLDVVNTSSFGGAMTLNNNLETTGTSSFGGDMTINGNVTHTGESFIMNNGTNDKISLTHNGTSSFSGLMTVNNINCDNYVDIEHPTAGGLRIYNDNTGSEKASILQDGTGSFYSNVYINAVVDNTSTNPALKVAGRTLLDGGLSVSSTESSSFAGLVRFDGTSSFGDDMTLNNIVTQTGESFIMQGPDTNGTTGDRISLTHNGTSSFSGLMTVNNINCDTYVDIINSATGGLRIGTGTSSNFIQNATVLQDGTSSFAGAMELKNELTIDGHTYWKHNGSDRCKLTVGSGIADSEMLIRGGLKINNGPITNASISSGGDGVLIQLTCGGFIHPDEGPGNTFNFGGEIQAVDIAITSDERLKSDIKKIPKALDKVKELSGYTYTINEKQSAGVIAQELLKVLPESVTTRDDGYYSVTYHGLIGLLIEAVKELSEKVK